MTSMDPLFYNSNPAFNVALNIYDRLIMQDAQQRMAKSVDNLRHELQRLRTGRALGLNRAPHLVAWNP